jgi:nucleotide-binding universal stress UspA family protein
MSSILVPVDGSELSERILSLMNRLPNPAAVKLFLLLVVPSGESDYTLASAMSYLGDLERRLRETGFEVQHALQEGDPAERILATANMLKPSLVALSTRGKGGAEGYGSVATAVVRACPVPLLIANPDPLPLEPGLGFSRILVPLDGTLTSARILPHVEGLALQFASEVVLLNVAPSEDALVDLSAQRASLEKAGVKKVRALTAVGEEAAQILAVAKKENADLLALTSHSRPDDTERPFGSVADVLVREAPCPLFVDRVVLPGIGG